MWNQFKTFLLLLVLTGILLLIGWLIGGYSGLTIGLIFALAINFFTYWYSDKFVLWIYRAKEASPSRYPGLHSAVEEMARKAKIPKPRVFVVPLEIANAFATGRNPKHSVVAVTEGLLHKLDKRELKGVLAHEISHIKNRDILIATIAATIAGVISYFAMIARYSLFFEERKDIINFLILVVAAIFVPIAALLIQLAISRSREYIADESGARLIKDPIALANALLGLEKAAREKPLRQGYEATAHLFIVNPFSAGTLVKLFSTHPPIKERVERLKALKI